LLIFQTEAPIVGISAFLVSNLQTWPLAGLDFAHSYWNSRWNVLNSKCQGPRAQAVAVVPHARDALQLTTAPVSHRGSPTALKQLSPICAPGPYHQICTALR